MADFAEITFPYLRTDDDLKLNDVEFGKRCVVIAIRGHDEKALGMAVEAVSRAVVAEAVARFALAFASPADLRGLVTAVTGSAPP